MLSVNPDINPRLLDLLGRGAGVGLWSWEPASGEFRWSHQCRVMLGYLDYEGSLTIDLARKLVHPEDIEGARQAFAEHFSSTQHLKLEVRLRRKTGEFIPVLIRAACLCDEQGEMIWTSGSLEDLTERRAREAELRDSQEFLRLVNDKNPDLVFVKNSRFEIVEANPAFLALYPEEMRDGVIGTTTLESYDTGEAAAFLAEDRKAFEEGASEVTETIRFPDGVTRVLLTRKTRFENAQGEAFILAVGRDQTEREVLIDRLSKSNQELERFAYICSHDLQEPLRMVNSFSERLQQELDPALATNPGLAKSLKFVRQGAQRAMSLVQEILTYSTTGNSTEKMVNVDLNQTFLRVRERLLDSAEEQQALTDHWLSKDHLPTVSGNETQLYQLLSNLVGNSVKYRCVDRPLRIKIECQEMGEFWEIAVVDNGIGIEERFFTRIFDIFGRLHRADQYPGTGIGLALCKKIIENRGGRIWVVSEVGEGSRFAFTYPKAFSTETTS